MSTLSESYENFINPINTGAATSRPGGDTVNIGTNSTSGKKSNKTILEELQIAAAERAAAETAATPVDADAQRLQWEKEDQALQAASDTRAEAALKLQQEQDARDARAAKIAEQDAAISRRTALINQQRAEYARQAEAYQNSQMNEAIQLQARHKYTGGDQMKHYMTEANAVPFQGANPFTGRSMGTFERNTGQTPQAVLTQIQRGNVSPSTWSSAYNVLGPRATSALYGEYQAKQASQKANPNSFYNQYGFR